MSAASAPGKLVLAGEYAVLEGAPAIVAAVQTRAVVRLDPAGTNDADDLPPEVRATRELVEAAHGKVPGRLILDVASLRAGEHKLGVGSSAAATVAAAALLRAERGELLDVAGREKILNLALAGHRAVAPRGSGIDVVASTYGGVQRFKREGDRIDHKSYRFPEGLFASVVFTGHSARTSDLLARVDRLAAIDPALHRKSIDAIAEAARAFVRGFESNDIPLLIDVTRRHHEALAALGRNADAPIVDTSLDTIAAIAREHRGAAKPSGAGGGDVAVAFFATAIERTEFEEEAVTKGFTIVDATLGGEGVRIDTSVGRAAV